MKVSLSWLKQYIDIDISIEELCHKMVSVGFEIEEVINLSEGISNVVVGKVLSISNHPNADKLKICKVDVGKEVLQIITGANNVSINNLVPIALNGATLPNGKTITSGQLRGELSQGMMCSGTELKITDSIYLGASKDGILILDDSEIVGTNIINVLELNDYCLDISITSNRPDCNSVYGITREIAAILNKQIRPLDLNYTSQKNDNIKNYLSVSVNDKHLCPYYSAAVVTDVVIAPSPLWLTRRLASVGQKSINNFVDITNYILLLLGHPMHAFDYSQINDKTIIVRRAKDKEQIIPFDEKTYLLDDQNLVISDKNKAVAIAGIMGGLKSGITSQTSSVVFESAVFNRENIRRSSKRLGLVSDASSCYSKGTNSYTANIALKHALHLVNQLNAGKIVSNEIVVDNSITNNDIISFEYSEIKKILGVDIDVNTSINILKSLNIIANFNKGVLSCTIPEYRSDITSGCDIAEELIRYYGYDNIQSSLLCNASITQGANEPKRKYINRLKTILTGLGYNEIVTYSFVGEQLYNKLGIKCDNLIKIINPLGDEVSYMRDTLVANMLKVISTNYNRKNSDIRIYEISRIYRNKCNLPDNLPQEINMLSIGGCTDFYTVKNAIEQISKALSLNFEYKRSKLEYLHSAMAADIYCNDVCIGYVGIIHPQVASNFDLDENTCICQINIDILYNYVTNSFIYKAIPKFPCVIRDLAVVVNNEVEVGSLIKCITSSSDIIENVQLLSVYNDNKLGDNNSVAFSITMRSNDRTLTDTEVEHTMSQILTRLESLNAKLR